MRPKEHENHGVGAETWTGGPSAPTGQRGWNQMRQPRLAEMVASALRDEILSGSLTEGDTLPRQEDLLADFQVSPPAVREALRILETEGLVSVRRGNVGGAVVHVPSARGVAYMVSLVQQVHGIPLTDVGHALRELEPLCAAMCATRPDRDVTVVPALEDIVAEQARVVNDVIAYNRAARRFHETIVSECGNRTMILVIGALESVWTAHEHRVYELGPEPGSLVRRSAIRAHAKLAQAISNGSPDAVAQIARRHLDLTQTFTMATDGDKEVHATLVRQHVLPT